jgi:hypothetical protein
MSQCPACRTREQPQEHTPFRAQPRLSFGAIRSDPGGARQPKVATCRHSRRRTCRDLWPRAPDMAMPSEEGAKVQPPC